MNPARHTPAWQRRGAALALCALPALAFAQNAAAPIDPALVGPWVAESISDERGIQRWTIERKADGTFSAHHLLVKREGLQERDVTGRWRAQDGVLHMDPALDTGKPGAWRYEAQQADCQRLEAVDPGSGAPLKPAHRFGECRSLQRWPVPDAVHQTCVLDKPLFPKRAEADLRIAREADGQFYATTDAQREANPVEVRDYPVLRDFDPRKPATLTNAGEAMLTLVQASVERDAGFARTLGFKPQDARGARIYVLAPPRPQRPMEYYSAGRNTLVEAIDASGKSMGMAMYAPFIIPCPRAAGD